MSTIETVKEFEHKGLKCTIKKVTFFKERGHLNGYVELPKQFTEVSMDDLPLSVHGGITYKDKEVIGFDCAHDFTEHYKDYWNVERVEEECKRLAECISALTWDNIVMAKIDNLKDYSLPKWFTDRAEVNKK